MIDAARAQRRAHHRRHVHLHRRRHRPRRGDAVLGAGRRTGEMDRAAEGPGHARQGEGGDARSRIPRPGRTSMPARGPKARCFWRSRIPSSKPLTGKTLAEVAKERERKPRRRGDRSGDRGRLARGRRLFPDERGQRPPRGRAAVDELRLGRGGARAGRRVPALQLPSARLRQFRAAARASMCARTTI